MFAAGANSLSTTLAPTATGESVGLFNAATSLAAAFDSALTGAIFGAGGFTDLAAIGAVAVAVGLALALRALWLRQWNRPVPAR